jgi:predicted RNase H-like HicB family nuclease
VYLEEWTQIGWYHTTVEEYKEMRVYTAVIERCKDTGLYVGYIPGFPGAHSQAKTLDQLRTNLEEVLLMLLEDGEPLLEADFVGTQSLSVAQ